MVTRHKRERRSGKAQPSSVKLPAATIVRGLPINAPPWTGSSDRRKTEAV
jgi:hypothetical protein